MADVKITTPDGKIPSNPEPVEGVDYEVSKDAPKNRDLILRDGKAFTQYFTEIPKSPNQVEPVVPKTSIELIMDRLDKIEAKIDGLPH